MSILIILETTGNYQSGLNAVWIAIAMLFLIIIASSKKKKEEKEKDKEGEVLTNIIPHFNILY
ncbi:MAG: hypothetical protein H6Q16_515 [Bacteroidetes bacterium]|nr:hypothetical protein [Bacteroidota bacterium]